MLRVPRHSLLKHGVGGRIWVMSRIPLNRVSNGSVDSYPHQQRAAKRAGDDAPRGAQSARAGHLKR
jgi:hypothetical protein